MKARLLLGHPWESHSACLVSFVPTLPSGHPSLETQRDLSFGVAGRLVNSRLSSNSYEAEKGLPLSPKFWDDRPGVCYGRVGTHGLCMLDKYSTNWASPPSPSSSIFLLCELREAVRQTLHYHVPIRTEGNTANPKKVSSRLRANFITINLGFYCTFAKEVILSHTC